MSDLLQRIRRAVALNGFWIPLQFQDTALPAITIPAAIDGIAPGDKIHVLSVVIALMSAMAMIVPPVAGAISDRLRGAGVPRRLLIWLGIAIDIVALLALAGAHSLNVFLGFVLLATFGANISLAAYQAMIPDIVPPEQWGFASGIRNIATLVGVILGFAVAGMTTVPTTFIAVAIAGAAGALTLLGLRERRPENFEEEERAHVTDWNDFFVVFVARFFLAFGLALLMTYVVYFFQDILHVKNASMGTAFVGFASLGGAIVSGVYLGWLSDRVSRKIIVALCGIPMTLAAAGFALFPEEHAMYGFAVLFGIGFGGIMSTGWALAIDAVPKLRDVARDLGIWGIAQNLPQIIAPLVGGYVLNAYAKSEAGYQVLFFAAAGCFAIGSATVLAVGRRRALPWWGPPIRVLAALSVYLYMHATCRIRRWGRLPRGRRSALVISNHQIDADLMEPFAVFMLTGGYSTVLSVSARMMYEPGFMAMRVPALWRLFHNANFGWLFRALGMLPLENELQTRSIGRWAYALQRRHGALPLTSVFKPAFLRSHDLQDIATTADLFTARNFARARDVRARLSDLQTAYRKEVFDETRTLVEQDLNGIEEAVRNGSTFYVTPEGEYPADGRMLPFRGIWERLLPAAAEIYLCAISYDPLRTGRFSQLYNVVPLQRREDAVNELKRARPVTVSALLAAVVRSAGGIPPQDLAVARVRELLESLPAGAFVDPELAKEPAACTRDALRGLRSLGSSRVHPRFERTADIIEHQAAFLEETIAACVALGPNGRGP